MAIAAHPIREQFVAELVESIKSPDAVTIAWDREEDIWDTHQRAWLQVPEWATHHLVLQDDALVCEDFYQLACSAAGRMPANPISFYFGNALNHPKIVRTTQQAQRENASWIKASGTWWGVAVMLPRQLINDMIKFCQPRRETYDRRLTIWCEDREHEVFYPYPSLVEHRDEPSVLYPGRRPGRKAYRYIGAGQETWDPTGGVVQCGRLAGRTIRLGKRREG